MALLDYHVENPIYEVRGTQCNGGSRSDPRRESRVVRTIPWAVLCKFEVIYPRQFELSLGCKERGLPERRARVASQCLGGALGGAPRLAEVEVEVPVLTVEAISSLVRKAFHFMNLS